MDIDQVYEDIEKGATQAESPRVLAVLSTASAERCGGGARLCAREDRI